MSKATAFDSHKYVKRATATGLTEPQAVMLAEEQGSVLNANLALKQDIGELRTELRQEIAAVRLEIAALRTELKQDIALVRLEIAASRADIIKWMSGLMITLSALVVGLIKLL